MQRYKKNPNYLFFLKNSCIFATPAGLNFIFLSMFVEQISVEYTLCFVFYGGTALMALIACIYLCLRRGNAFAADVTPPMQLRRWAAAFFALAFLSHVWWLLFYIYSNNYNSVACLVVAVIDYLGLLVSIAGTLFAMLQDRKRPIWPMVVAMIPYAVLLTMNVVFPDHHFLYIAIIYLMMVFVLFSVYMVYAVRQYRHWLRDNYADLEHKEVWASHVLIIAILLLFTFGEVEGISLTISFLVPRTSSVLVPVVASRDNAPIAGRSGGTRAYRTGTAAATATTVIGHSLQYRTAVGRALRGRPALFATRPDPYPTGSDYWYQPLLSQPIFLPSGHHLQCLYQRSSHQPLHESLSGGCRCPETHFRPTAGPRKRLPELQHLQSCVQAAHGTKCNGLDA